MTGEYAYALFSTAFRSMVALIVLHNLYDVIPTYSSSFYIFLTFLSSKFDNFRSDAQRAAKQKEAKERELEQCSFSAERIEEGGFPLSMVRKNVTLKNVLLR